MNYRDEKSENYYEILGIETDATVDQIKTSYKKLVLQLHPDQTARMEDLSEDEKIKREEQFKLVVEAYEILSDQEKKNSYDEQLLPNRRRDNQGMFFFSSERESYEAYLHQINEWINQERGSLKEERESIIDKFGSLLELRNFLNDWYLEHINKTHSFFQKLPDSLRDKILEIIKHTDPLLQYQFNRLRFAILGFDANGLEYEVERQYQRVEEALINMQKTEKMTQLINRCICILTYQTLQEDILFLEKVKFLSELESELYNLVLSFKRNSNKLPSGIESINNMFKSFKKTLKCFIPALGWDFVTVESHLTNNGKISQWQLYKINKFFWKVKTVIEEKQGDKPYFRDEGIHELYQKWGVRIEGLEPREEEESPSFNFAGS